MLTCFQERALSEERKRPASVAAYSSEPGSGASTNWWMVKPGAGEVRCTQVRPPLVEEKRYPFVNPANRKSLLVREGRRALTLRAYGPFRNSQ
jgi:hypothetical protein